MTQKNKKNAATTEVSQEGVQTDRNGTVEAPADAVSEPAASAAETAPATDISGEEAGASFSGSEAPEASDRTSDKKPAATAKDPACTTKTPARGSGTVRKSAAQCISREVFRSYPDRKAVHVASDGTAFFNRCDAVNYGRTLKDTTVVEVTNQNLKA